LGFFGKLGPCKVGIEACASAHFWAREIAALGHDVKLIPPADVKPFVKRQMNDGADAERSQRPCNDRRCGSRPSMRASSRPGMVLHRTRHLFVREQTALTNAICVHMAEFGVVACCRSTPVYTLQHTIPHLTRSSLHRCL
jgi:transposase